MVFASVSMMDSITSFPSPFITAIALLQCVGLWEVSPAVSRRIHPE
jgi:hypothetical protein